MFKGVGYQLGTFSDKLTAALNYDAASRKLKGDGVVTNFPSKAKSCEELGLNLERIMQRTDEKLGINFWPITNISGVNRIGGNSSTDVGKVGDVTTSSTGGNKKRKVSTDSVVPLKKSKTSAPPSAPSSPCVESASTSDEISSPKLQAEVDVVDDIADTEEKSNKTALPQVVLNGDEEEEGVEEEEKEETEDNGEEKKRKEAEKGKEKNASAGNLNGQFHKDVEVVSAPSDTKEVKQRGKSAHEGVLNGKGLENDDTPTEEREEGEPTARALAPAGSRRQSDNGSRSAVRRVSDSSSSAVSQPTNLQKEKEKERERDNKRKSVVPIQYEWWMDSLEAGQDVQGNWKALGKFYPGKVVCSNGRTKRISIKYDDGDYETDMTNEKVRILVSPEQRKELMEKGMQIKRKRELEEMEARKLQDHLDKLANEKKERDKVRMEKNRLKVSEQ